MQGARYASPGNPKGEKPRQGRLIDVPLTQDGGKTEKVNKLTGAVKQKQNKLP